MHIAEIRTVAKSLPPLRWNTHKSLILSYSADFSVIFGENVRSQLYDIIEIKEDNLTRIEKVEYNGQHSYNLTYSKENTLYPEFYIIQTDKQGNIKDVLKSR